MSASVPDAYEKVCERAYRALLGVLLTHTDARDLDALTLWEKWQPLDHPRLDGVDPEITILQWSVALDAAREELSLPQLPRYATAVIGPMADPGVRECARLMRDGMFAQSPLGTSFHCPCGWVSPAVEPMSELGGLISEHLAAVHAIGSTE